MPLRSFENISIFYKRLPVYNPQFTYAKPYRTNANNSSELYDTKQTKIASVSLDGRRYPRDILYFNNVISPRYHFII